MNTREIRAITHLGELVPLLKKAIKRIHSNEHLGNHEMCNDKICVTFRSYIRDVNEEFFNNTVEAT